MIGIWCWSARQGTSGSCCRWRWRSGIDRDDGGCGDQAHVEQAADLLRSGIHENQIVAVRKTARPGEPAPAKAGDTLADLLAGTQTDLRRIAAALRKVATQARFLDRPDWPALD
jgi:hypothetical protein